LLAGLDDTLARRVVVALNSLQLSFHRSPLPAVVDASSGLPSGSLAVAIFAFLGDPRILAEIERLMAWLNGAGRRTKVVVLYPTDQRQILVPRIGREITRAVALDSIERELRGTVSRLLGEASGARVDHFDSVTLDPSKTWGRRTRNRSRGSS
jgi:hypothetical protein